MILEPVSLIYNSIIKIEKKTSRNPIKAINENNWSIVDEVYHPLKNI